MATGSTHGERSPGTSGRRRLNVGCGRDIRPASDGWVNLDIAALPGVDAVHNILDVPWPFEDGAFDDVLAMNILEHIPHHLPSYGGKDGLLVMLEELHRIMAPNGYLHVSVPHYQSRNAWRDPTHTRAMTPDWWTYYDPREEDFQNMGAHYTTARFHHERTDVYWSLDFRPLPFGDYHANKYLSRGLSRTIRRTLGRPKIIETILRRLPREGEPSPTGTPRPPDALFQRPPER